jgi:hypothetical protein
VVVLVLGFGLALGLAGAAFAVGLCGLFGEQCTASEERTIGLLMLGAIGVFVLVPIVVAIARRQARWLLAPVIEAMLIAAVFAAYEWF